MSYYLLLTANILLNLTITQVTYDFFNDRSRSYSPRLLVALVLISLSGGLVHHLLELHQLVLCLDCNLLSQLVLIGYYGLVHMMLVFLLPKLLPEKN